MFEAGFNTGNRPPRNISVGLALGRRLSPNQRTLLTLPTMAPSQPTPLSSRPTDIFYIFYHLALFLGVTLVDGQIVFPTLYPSFLRDLWLSSSKSLPHPLQLEGMQGGAAFYRIGIMGTALFVVAPCCLYLISLLYTGSQKLELPGLILSIHVLTNMVVADSDILFTERRGVDWEIKMKCLGTHVLPYVAGTLFAIRCAKRLVARAERAEKTD